MFMLLKSDKVVDKQQQHVIEDKTLSTKTSADQVTELKAGYKPQKKALSREEEGAHATSLSEPRPTGVVELTLTQDHVPEPFLAFDRNVHLTWQDFKEIKRRFEEEEGQPFEYYRKPTDTLDWNHWWVERIGVDDQGEDIYRLTDLLSFSESAFEILSKLQEREFEELYHQTHYGQMSTALETFARESFPQYLVGSTSYALQPIVCRQMKCLIKAMYDEKAKFDIAKYATRMEEHMESQLSQGHKCSGGWDAILTRGNIIRVVCASKG